MSTTTQNSTVEAKLLELCEAIAADSTVLHAREQAEAFLADEAAVSTYREMMNMGRQLDRRHHAGEKITEAEIEAYEELQEKNEAHPGIRAFNQAQQTLQQIANNVNSYVTKTIEKGRVPAPEEISSGGGCCGGSGAGSCGC